MTPRPASAGDRNVSQRPPFPDYDPTTASTDGVPGNPFGEPLDGLELAPALEANIGRYSIRFAKTNGDLAAVRRLRYAVFNVEMGEGLAGAHETGLDADAFDRQCQHLMVSCNDTGAVVGTYRMQIAESANAGHGWYTAGEFELDSLPAESIANAAELGRACVARAHRDKAVLFLLWHGLIAYGQHNDVDTYFGCSSLTGTDPEKGVALYSHLLATGAVHPTLHVAPRRAMACPLLDWPARKGSRKSKPEIPKLFASYLRYGAKVLGPPAIDEEFGTIDFLTWVEVTDQHIRRFGQLR